MPWWGWLLLVLGLLLLFFLWSAIHELAHYLAARTRQDVVSAEFKIYPHVDPVAGFRFAAVSWRFFGPQLEGRDRAFVSLAPRIPDVVGVLLFPIATVFPEPWAYIWMLVWIGALIDGAWGSIGYNEHSDLRKASAALDISPWWLRVGGWSAAVTSASVGVGLLFW